MISSRKAKYQLMVVGLLSQICILCFFLLFSFNSNATQCLEFSNNFTSGSTGQEYVVYYQNHHSMTDCQFDVVTTDGEYQLLKSKAEILDNLENEFMSAEHFDYLTQFLFAAFAFFAYVKGFSNGNTRD
jgi:fructose-1,6-bisphosphatase